MRSSVPTLAVLSLTLCLAGPSSAQDGQRYTSSPGRFSITFPGAVEESTDTTRTEDGSVLTVNMVAHAPSDEMVYLVSWVDMTRLLQDDVPMKALLENSRDGSTGSMQATNVSTLELDSTGTHPFVDFTFDAGTLSGRERILFVDKFQYALITLYPSLDGAPKQAKDFFASFKAEGKPRK